MKIERTRLRSLIIYDTPPTTITESRIMGTPVKHVDVDIRISLEESDNITTDEQKLALWQQIADAIAEVRDS